MQTVTVVGRPNVGKSALFNRILGRSQSIVNDVPGVTRDVLVGRATWEDQTFLLQDTGGLIDRPISTLEKKIRHKVLEALGHADLILFVVDGREGPVPEDETLLELVRACNKFFFLVINKIDPSSPADVLMAPFYRWGVAHTFCVSAAHGLGVAKLLDRILTVLKPPQEAQDEGPRALTIAILGRPNMGKSTLFNLLLGHERALTDAVPGTTRDVVGAEITHRGKRIALLDTAGIRRRGRTLPGPEKLSVVMGLKSLVQADVVLLLLDASEGITDQDTHVAGAICEHNKPLVILVNKVDLVERAKLQTLAEDIKMRFGFISYAPALFISALSGAGVDQVLTTMERLHRQAGRRVETHTVMEVFQDILKQHPHPTSHGKNIKLGYATQASAHPPTFVIFCNQPRHVHFSYRRYLTNQLRARLGFPEVPVRLLFRAKGGR